LGWNEKRINVKLKREGKFKRKDVTGGKKREKESTPTAGILKKNKRWRKGGIKKKGGKRGCLEKLQGGEFSRKKQDNERREKGAICGKRGGKKNHAAHSRKHDCDRGTPPLHFWFLWK